MTLSHEVKLATWITWHWAQLEAKFLWVLLESLFNCDHSHSVVVATSFGAALIAKDPYWLSYQTRVAFTTLNLKCIDPTRHAKFTNNHW